VKQFAEWVTRRAYRAGIIAAALALVPLLGVAGSGLLVLTSLRRGSGAAWLAAAIATLVLLVASAAGGAGVLAAALAGLAVLVGGIATGQTIFANLMVVVLFSFALQGLALVHAFSAARGWPSGVLALVYVMLLFGMSVVAPLLAVVGMVDNWLNFRGRLAGPPRG